MSEYRFMSTAKLLRLLGSRGYRRKHDVDTRYYASTEIAEYTDAMDESIVDDVASELEDRIDEGRKAARHEDE